MRHLAFLLLLLVWAPRAAAGQPAVTLTLDDAITRAVQTSHRLSEARAREQSAQAVIDVTRAAENPTVTVNGSYTRTNHVMPFFIIGATGLPRVIYPDIPDNYFTRVSFQWPIYTGGRVDALERAAAAEARAAGAEVDVARADLRLEVSRVYWALVTAVDAERVVEGALQRSDAHLRDVRTMFDAGLIPPNDVSSVEAARARQQLQLIEAQNVRRSVAEELKRLTGIGANVEVSASEPLLAPGRIERPPAEGAKPRSLESLSQQLIPMALKERADRQAIVARVEAAEDRETAAAAGRQPTIALSGGLDYANPNPRIFPRVGEWNESWDLAANVTWSLWDGGRTKAEVAEAAAATTAMRERLAEIDTLIALEIKQRQLDIDSANAAITAAGEGIRSAEEARRVVAERFRVGVATSTEVLDAQVALLQAELDRTQAISNLRFAEARLDRALGR